jgi:hypothetical protein
MHYRSALLGLSVVLISACSSVDTNNKPEHKDVASQQVTVQGSAVILNENLERARQAAIENAIANASGQIKRHYSNKESLLPGNIKIVDEWQADNYYHVQAVALLGQQATCQSPYRKKMVATGFPVMNADQISGTESQDLFSGIPREISNRLMESGDFITRNVTNTVLYSRPDLAPEIFSTTGGNPLKVIIDIAKGLDAQFVLSGVIRDFKVESTEYVRGSGVLAMLKSTMRDYIARRSIGIDVFVHDGFTGALLFQHRYTDSILGDVSLPTGYNVGSEGFESSPAGHKISEIIHQASNDIQQLFACHPFATRVTQVDNNQITIGAGAQNRIKTGDRFSIYNAGFSDSASIGFTEPVGMMTISHVGPSMAIGNFESGMNQIKIHPGDWVRSLPTQ